jgi:ubiquinone/menaquinone biosynthesis C-methylase UbiE
MAGWRSRAPLRRGAEPAQAMWSISGGNPCVGPHHVRPRPDSAMRSWLSYWNAPNASYVNERHKRAHYDVVFAGARPHLPRGPGRIVLDWGCGDEKIADVSGAVILYDAAATTRQRLRERYGGHPRIHIVDGDSSEVQPNSIDLVIINSVIQYFSDEEFDSALRRIHVLLTDEGALLLGDVINPGTPMFRHVTTFLRFAGENGFLLPAVLALARTSMSSYRSLQREIGLATYAPTQIVQKLEQRGFVAQQLPENIAVSPYRTSFIARKQGAARPAASG